MPQVFLFMLRGCSAAWLGAYGNEWVGTPQCDRLAAEGIVWDRYFVDQPDPAWQSRRWAERLLPALSDRGVHTLCVLAHTAEHDYPQSFYEAWTERFEARPTPQAPSLQPLLELWPAVLDRLSPDGDFLVWVDIGSLLPPWTVQEEVFQAYLDLSLDAPGDDADGPGDAAKPAAHAAKPVGNATPPAGDAMRHAGDAAKPAAHAAKPVGHAAKPAGNIAPPAGLPGDASLSPLATTTDDGTSDDDAAADELLLPCIQPPIGPFDVNDDAAWRWLHTSFAAVVTALDAELGQLWEQLRQRGLDRSSHWVLTSDRGQPLGEHGRVGWDRPWLHAELVHVPLIWRLPAAEQAGRRIAALTQPPDLLATLANLWQVAIPDGYNLWPAMHGPHPAPRQEAVCFWTVDEAAEAALRTPEWALLFPLRLPAGEDRPPQLYAKPEDRWEVNDLRLRNLEQTDTLAARLRQLLPERFGEQVLPYLTQLSPPE